MKKQPKPQFEPLEKVIAPDYCLYTPVQKDLERLYRNQEKIYVLLQKVIKIESMKGRYA